MRVCSIDTCDSSVLARGFCSKHYQRWRHHGDPLFALIDYDHNGHCAVGWCERTYSAKGFCKRHYERHRKYEVDAEWLTARPQCEVCGDDGDNYKYGLHVDHCHQTGKNRGMLCHACNTALGAFKHNPTFLRKAADYLEDA